MLCNLKYESLSLQYQCFSVSLLVLQDWFFPLSPSVYILCICIAIRVVLIFQSFFWFWTNTKSSSSNLLQFPLKFLPVDASDSGFKVPVAKCPFIYELPGCSLILTRVFEVREAAGQSESKAIFPLLFCESLLFQLARKITSSPRKKFSAIFQNVSLWNMNVSINAFFNSYLQN